jgi:hypothetical protein
MIIFTLGLTLGFTCGVLFYNWWIAPDVVKLRKQVSNTEEKDD